jgi:hypothetical protein
VLGGKATNTNFIVWFDPIFLQSFRLIYITPVQKIAELALSITHPPKNYAVSIIYQGTSHCHYCEHDWKMTLNDIIAWALRKKEAKCVGTGYRHFHLKKGKVKQGLIYENTQKKVFEN